MSFQYELIEPFATTPFGTIHRGCNFNQQSEVAVLELFAHYREDPVTLNDIWHEILPICNLKHDFLVPVVDVDKSRGWIITEMRGENLASIAKKAPLPQNVVRTLLRNLLELLEFFESQRFIHGDIRPEMLALPQNLNGRTLEQLRVRLFPSLGVSLCGEVPLAKRDPKHLAPEMLNQQFGQITHATDLYCLGLTALELLAGPKFDSYFQRVGQDTNTAWHFWHGNVSEQLPTPQEIVPDLADDLNLVLTRMLTKTVADRPYSAKEVASLLAHFAPEPIPVQLIAGHVDVGVPTRQNFSEVTVTTDFSTAPTPNDAVAVQVGRSNPPIKEKKNMQQSNNANRTNRKPWSKAWCDEQINKPHIFAGVAAFFLIVAVIIGLFLKSLLGDGTIPVSMAISPNEAIVTADKKNYKPNDSGEYFFSPGIHSVRITADGYEPLEIELVIPDDSEEQPTATAGGRKQDLNKIALKPMPVSVMLAIQPEEATVSIGEENLISEDGEYFLLPGKHSLKISADGYEPFDLTITITREKSGVDIKATSAGKAVDLKKTIRLKKIVPPAPELPVAPEPPVVAPEPPVVVAVPPRSTPDVPSPNFTSVGTETNDKGLFKQIKSNLCPDLEFVLIEPGAFTFGVASGERHWGELDGASVTIDEAFYIAITEISRSQYKWFLEKNTDHIAPKNVDSLPSNFPVTDVSHADATAFCQWIGGRLPTEREWEYAARYPKFDIPHPWGTAPVSMELANLFHGSAVPVSVMKGDKGKSPSGLLNMIGNVSEWCSDPYQVGFGESATDEAFKGAFVIKSPSFKVPIGPEVRITWRSPLPIVGSDDVGFRPVVSLQNAKLVPP